MKKLIGKKCREKSKGGGWFGKIIDTQGSERVCVDYGVWHQWFALKDIEIEPDLMELAYKAAEIFFHTTGGLGEERLALIIHDTLKRDWDEK